MKELRIGNLTPANPFFLAPLAGITDAPMRRLCKEQGAAMVFSEMVSGKGLWYNDKNTARLLKTYEEERPVAFQIFGHEPEIMAFTATELSKLHCEAIDINMGCPVPKIVKNGEGAALLKNPDLVYDIVAAVVKNTDKPVTVKIRIGWDKNSINAVEVAHAISAAGASAITVHGRTREQYYSGKADWEIIRQVKEAVKIPVIGNGDITDASSAKKMMEETGCDGIMVARAAKGNPWIFRELKESFEGQPISPRPTYKEVCQMILRHASMQIEYVGEHMGMLQMRKQVAWYTAGYPGSSKLRQEVNQITTYEELKSLLTRFAVSDIIV